MRRNGMPSFREAIVLTCLRDGKERYVSEINLRYKKITGERMPSGAVHSTLYRMERIGLIASSDVKTDHPHGGADRHSYAITDKGRSCSDKIEEIARRMYGIFRYHSRKEE